MILPFIYNGNECTRVMQERFQGLCVPLTNASTFNEFSIVEIALGKEIFDKQRFGSNFVLNLCLVQGASLWIDMICF